MSHKRAPTVVTQYDLASLLLHDVRYALGRHTWVPQDCVGRLQRYWEALDPSMRKLIVRDVKEYVTRAERTSKGCDSVYDRPWANLLLWIENREKGADE